MPPRDDLAPCDGLPIHHADEGGYDYIIPAFKRLVAEYPNAHLLIANAIGPEKQEIQNLLSELPENSFTEILFEENLFALYQCFDLYVFTPIDFHIEAFGQTYIEALASGTPSIFTKSGIGNQVAVDGENCLVVEHQNSDQIFEAMKKIITDDNLRKNLSGEGMKSVEEKFGIKTMIKKLEALYLS